MPRPHGPGNATSAAEVAVATATLTRGHTYDTLGRPASTTYPTWSADDDAVTVDYGYNARGHLEKLEHGATDLVSVTPQTAYGQAKTSVHGNGAEGTSGHTQSASYK